MEKEMLTLTKNSNIYILSQANRSYSRAYYVAGTSSRSITGKLNQRIRALKTAHNISWSALTFDTAPDGGLGLADLEDLMLAGGVYKLTVSRYGSESEDFDVVFDPAQFSASLVALPGLNRRLWQVSVSLLEV